MVAPNCSSRIAAAWRCSLGGKHPAGALARSIVSNRFPSCASLPVFGDLNNDRRVDFVVPRDPPNPQEALLIFGQNSNGSFSLPANTGGRDHRCDGYPATSLVSEPRRPRRHTSRRAEYSRNNRLERFASATQYAVAGRASPLPPRFADQTVTRRTDRHRGRPVTISCSRFNNRKGRADGRHAVGRSGAKRSDAAAIPVDWSQRWPRRSRAPAAQS